MAETGQCPNCLAAIIEAEAVDATPDFLFGVVTIIPPKCLANRFLEASPHLVMDPIAAMGGPPPG